MSAQLPTLSKPLQPWVLKTRENEIAVLNMFTFNFSLHTDLVFPWFKYIFRQSEIIFDNTNNTGFGIGITTTGKNRQLLINSLIQGNSDLVQDV